MKLVKPVDVWDIQPWGGPMVKIADFNGDGRNEVLFLQSAGAHANEAFDPRSDIKAGYKTGAEDQDLFCMTLVDAAGKMIWQVGEAWALERPFSWNGHGSEFCDVVDLDADGRVEFMFVHQDQLRVYDGATGELCAATSPRRSCSMTCRASSLFSSTRPPDPLKIDGR